MSLQKSILIICALVCTFALGNPTNGIQFPTGEGFYQGDLKLTEEQKAGSSGRAGRLGLTDTRYRWPKDEQGLVIIPFIIRASSGYTPQEINTIIEGMDEIQRLTCIRFIPRTTQNDYVEYFSGDGCWSFVGKRGGRQELSLGRPGCVYKGAVIHESVHAIGFMHMQNAFDRDNYIRVAWENMDPKDYGAFDKVNPNDFSHFGTIYDYKSIMHYGQKTFSINGKDVMIPLQPNIGNLGGGDNLSPGDVKRINNMNVC